MKLAAKTNPELLARELRRHITRDRSILGHLRRAGLSRRLNQADRSAVFRAYYANRTQAN
jgi:hypothetical protein